MLPESSQLILFFIAALTLLLIPGPAVMYIIARSISQGKRGGFVSILGLAAGSLVHIAAAALGLSALLLASAHAFMTVKWLGAGYLIFLGLRTLLQANTRSEVSKQIPVGGWNIFLQGIVVNILNPKSALFFFAFLPQFIVPAAGSIPAQLFFLGMIFIILGILSDSIYVMLACTIGDRLQRSPKFMNRQKYFSGAVYVALGIGTAVTDASPGLKTR